MTQPHAIFSRAEPGDVFRTLGVEPLINCGGVRTQWGGTNPAPEVVAAMTDASKQFVDLDELADAVGRRLGELTGAPWGIVTAGTTAALALSAAACIAGNDPELMLRLPRTNGIPHRIVMLEHQRFDYDHALLAVGGEIISARDLQHLTALLDGSVVLICLLARRESSPSIDDIVRVAKSRNVPVLVDAAGLSPSRPDRWLQAGADLVVYSGGKYLRAPHSTGLLLGDKALCLAAWRNGAPHQAIGRAMKVGKEEMIGAVVALDRWLNSPSASEERLQWQRRIQLICSALADVHGVSVTPIPETAYVTAPRVRLTWDPYIIPHESELLRTRLIEGRPRILIHDFWSRPYSVVLDPINLTDAQARLVCERLRQQFSMLADTPPRKPAPPSADVSGDWSVHIDFLHGQSDHQLSLEQRGSNITGRHTARFSSGAVGGSIAADRAHFISKHPHGHLPIYYEFSGRVASDQLSGTVRVGAASDEHAGPVFQRQFGEARWHAHRRTNDTGVPA